MTKRIVLMVSLTLVTTPLGGASVIYLAPSVSPGWRPAAQYPPR